MLQRVLQLTRTMTGLTDMPYEIQQKIVDHFLTDLKLTELSWMHALSAVSPYWKTLVRQSLDDGLRRLTRHPCSCLTCQSIRRKRKRTVQAIPHAPAATVAEQKHSETTKRTPNIAVLYKKPRLMSHA